MDKYIIYYYIESKSIFRSDDEANISDNLDEAIDLLQFLKSEDDSISIYLIKGKYRINIWAGQKSYSYVLEIDSGYHGGTFSKEYSKKDLVELLSFGFEEILKDPKYYGFTYECW